MGKINWAIFILILSISINSFSAFGDVDMVFNLSNYHYCSPVSICYQYGCFFILESYINLNYDIYPLVKIHSLALGAADPIEIVKICQIFHYRNDLNGFCFVKENDSDFLWTAESLNKQLWQLKFLTTGEAEDFERYRTLKLPQEPENEYYPTGITIDNNKNLYFINGLNRSVYKIDYSVYSGSTGDIDISSEQITKLFEVPRAPSIPMGIEYESPGNLYFTLSGENDYLIKTNILGIELAYKDLHIQSNPGYISRFPTDLTLEDTSFIWFTDCMYDKLYRCEK